MGVYGIGSKINKLDLYKNFIRHNYAGIGWDNYDAPDLHSLIKSISIGDIIFIKSASPSSEITVKAIGIVVDDKIIIKNGHFEIGRNVKWINITPFKIPLPLSKYNCRMNTLYREYHPVILYKILSRI